MPQVLIRRERDGLEYEIASGDFRRGKHFRDERSGDMQTFEEAGFRIVSLADGQPYEAAEQRPSSGETSS